MWLKAISARMSKDFQTSFLSPQIDKLITLDPTVKIYLLRLNFIIYIETVYIGIHNL